MMMRKLMLSLFALMMAMSVNAQTYLNEVETPFAAKKFYVNAALSSAGLSYSKASEWSLSLNAKAGYFFLDDWMVLGVFGYNNFSSGTLVTTELGAGVRYYFDKVGLYLGAIAKYAHSTGFNDFEPELNVGYAFFLGKHVTLEPELYYEHSFKDKDYSGVGLRVGLGIYF